MGFWIWDYDDAPDDVIEAACLRAAEYFKEKGIAPSAAQDAAMEAQDLSQDFDGPTPKADLIVAWFKAENETFDYLYAVTGKWPSATGASLVYTQD